MIPFQIDTKAFILRNPRSGSTLLGLLLNSNRQVVSIPECGFLHYLFERYKNWNLNDLKTEKLNIFLDDFSRTKKINTWKIDLGKLKHFIQQVAPPNYEKLTELIYWFYKNKAAAKVIFDKNNYYIDHVEDLKKIWTKANYIHLVRDGRDVACSYKRLDSMASKSPFKPILPKELTSIENEWVNNNKANGMLSVWKSVLKISPYEHKREVRIRIANCERFLSRKYFQNKDYLNAFKMSFNALKNNPFWLIFTK